MAAASAVQRGRPRWTAQQRSEALWALVFISPWIVGFLVFTLGPMVWSFYLSLTDYDPLVDEANFIGIDNYVAMLSDRRVPTAMFNTVYFTVIFVPLSTALGLYLATLLNRVGRHGAGFFRTAFYLPNVTPAVAVGTLFLLLLASNGLVNQGLGLIGIDGPSWFNDPAWIKNGIILMMLWSIGGTVVILFAALRNVPPELYEAAKIDGASAWKQFLNITVPMISGALFFVIIVNTIASLQLFAEVYTIFFGQQAGQSASGETAALFYVIYLFRQAFEFFNMGYASALGWVLFVVIAIITWIQFRVSRELVYYENQ